MTRAERADRERLVWLRDLHCRMVRDLGLKGSIVEGTWHFLLAMDGRDVPERQMRPDCAGKRKVAGGRG